MLPNKNSNIVEVLQQRAMSHPDRECLIFLGDGENQSDSMTYWENDKAARHVAAAMQKRGVSKGDRVLIILPNSLEFVKIFYGCLYGGILAVHCMNLREQNKLNYIWKRSFQHWK